VPRVHARRLVASAVALAVVSASGAAFAAPRRPAAKKAFKRGVAAYTKGDYAAAAAALARSFKLEADAETLFAWAQTERKLDHCDRAIELYSKLLRMDLPAANKKAVSVQIGECKEILAAQKPEPEPPREPEPSVEPDRELDSEPVSSTSSEPEGSESRTSEPIQVHASSEGHAWWKDPVGGALVGVGLVGVGVGAVFLVQAHAAESDKATAASYEDFQALDDKAHSRGQLGVIGLAAGGAFVAVGALWYATRKSPSSPTVTGWLAPTGGGFAIAGGF
jgi:hypothetical protein